MRRPLYVVLSGGALIFASYWRYQAENIARTERHYGYHATVTVASRLISSFVPFLPSDCRP